MLPRQLVEPVQWEGTMRKLVAAGAPGSAVSCMLGPAQWALAVGGGSAAAAGECLQQGSKGGGPIGCMKFWALT